MKFYPFCLNTRLLQTSKAQGRLCTIMFAKQVPAPVDYNSEQPKPNHAGAAHRVPAEQQGPTPSSMRAPQSHPRAPDTPHIQGESACPLPNIRLIQTEKLQVTCFCDSYDKTPLSNRPNNWKALATCLTGQALKTILPPTNQEIS